MVDRPYPKFLWKLFERLRNRRFPLAPDDYEALKQAIRAGYDWSSQEALCDLCCALWAKSKREKEIIEALFDQAIYEFGISEWGSSEIDDIELASPVPIEVKPGNRSSKLPEPSASELPPITMDGSSLPPFPLDDDVNTFPRYSPVFAPQFPLTYREVAQAWRRLRRPVREGPPIELDVDATIDRRRRGLVSEVVLRPRRRNTTRLLLLVDRQGSMTPFHNFMDEVCRAIQQAGNLENVAVYYFHDTPAEGADETPLSSLSDQLFPTLDSILTQITPLEEGFVYEDPTLLSPHTLDKVLQSRAVGAAVAIFSDAGAARGHYDPLRLLDTVAFIKALRRYTTRYVWLNPLPDERYKRRKNTAAQIARHAPMFSLNRTGMYKAINILRGQPYLLERAV